MRALRMSIILPFTQLSYATMGLVKIAQCQHIRNQEFGTTAHALPLGKSVCSLQDHKGTSESGGDFL